MKSTVNRALPLPHRGRLAAAAVLVGALASPLTAHPVKPSDFDVLGEVTGCAAPNLCGDFDSSAWTGRLPATPVVTTDVTFTGEGLPCPIEPCDLFGVAVTSNLDLNNDLIVDLAVAASGVGKVYVFFGPLDRDRKASQADVVITGEDVNFPVLNRGPDHDINGDGFDDLIIAAINGGPKGSVLAGQVWIFHGPLTDDGIVAQGELGDADATLIGTNFFQLGRSLVSTDFDGDGAVDLLVGASQSHAGKVLVYPGSIQGVKTMEDATTTIDGVQPGESFGDAATVGDFSGDGMVDLAVGAEDFTLGSSSGRVYLFFGPGSPGQFSAATADLIIVGDASNDQFGSHVSSAGDVNGDELEDLLIGADEVFGPGNGNAYLFYAPLPVGDTTSADADVAFHGEPEGGFDRFAFVSGAGDVNADGFDDVVIGAPDAAGFDGGAHIFLGPLSGSLNALDADLLFTGPNDELIDRLGGALYGAGDLDNNGFDDVVLGAQGFEGPGFARIFYAPGLEVAASLQGPGTVPPEGGDLQFTVAVTNTSTARWMPDAWFTVESPGNGTFVQGPIRFQIDPTSRRDRSIQKFIPAKAPAGIYTLTAFAGRFPNPVASDEFTFEKLP